MSYSPQTLPRLTSGLARRLSYGLACALGVLGFLGLAADAVAQEPTTPRAAMREAAEEQADMDPAGSAMADAAHLQRAAMRGGPPREGAPGSDRKSSAVTSVAEPKSAAERLHHAMRAIAREEVARDLAAAEAAGRSTPVATRRSAAGKSGAVENEREQVRDTAAQVAKAVGAQRAAEAARGNGNAYGVGNANGNGNANGRAALSSPPGSAGAVGAARPR